MAKYKNDTTLEALAEIASALGEPKRLLALAMLARGELCLCDLTEALALSPSTVSNHMAILRRAGLVEARKEGRWAHFRLADTDPESTVAEALGWALGHLPKSVVPRVTCSNGACCP
ncbi:MAG TPA: metalloregulator ArsR/SmtB family transcription factor [Fibrobacteria bacterium]|nr:metalloregulator ArsR/SmtB family transcription factor [Fibrobacteria bacterium]